MGSRPFLKGFPSREPLKVGALAARPLGGSVAGRPEGEQRAPPNAPLDGLPGRARAPGDAGARWGTLGHARPIRNAAAWVRRARRPVACCGAVLPLGGPWRALDRVHSARVDLSPNVADPRL